MSKRFTDRVVVITGAGGGLGRTGAQMFAREGAELVLTDVNGEGLEETAAMLREEGAVCSTHVFDLADEDAIKQFGAQICEKHEKVHVLFNNAGIAYGEITGMVDTFSQAQWLKFLSINSIAPMILAQALRPALKNAGGVILNQSSMASYMPATAYGVTKATLNALTYGMAFTFGGDGIRVVAIAPGLMETPANKDSLPAETHERIQGMQMLKLHGTADDIANLALFLASDEARFINCEIVSCDGGNQIRGWRG